MIEKWDIYDEVGNRTGMTMNRGENDIGKFNLAVNIILVDAKENYLIQKRSEMKKSKPGIWDITSGAVLAGESSMEAAMRETYEELGISLKENDLYLMGRVKGISSFVDIWIAKIELDGYEFIPNDEVSQVKLIDKNQLKQLVIDSQYRDEVYKKFIEENF